MRLPLVLFVLVALPLALLVVSVTPSWAGHVPGSSETRSDEPAATEAASEADTPEARAQIDPASRALGITTALVPGALLHGSGHWALGERSTAYTLLAMEALGVVGIVGGIAGLAVTGAADSFVGPFATLTIAGTNLFFTSFLADLYGVTTTEPTGYPVVRRAPLDVRAGYQYVYNPALEDDASHFVTAGAAWAWRMLSLDTIATIGVDAESWRLQPSLRWRLIGPRPDRRSTSGAHLDLRFGFTHHSWGALGIIDNFGEAELLGRVDLEALAPTLKGSFINAHAGLAVGMHSYDLDVPSDSDTLLLGGFGFGFYLGDDPAGYGEFELYYDHRHDGYAAGYKQPGLGSGVGGHFGLRAEYGVWRGLGVGAHFEAGSAIVTGASLIWRLGGER